jgi:HlyD family secretion protein
MIDTSEKRFVRPARDEEFLPPVHRWISVGGLMLIGTLVIAFFLSAVTRYSVTVNANASIRPAGGIRLVQSELAGTVKYIAARENQTVRRGDVIAYLDYSQPQTRLTQLQDTIQQGILELAQVDAQIRALDTEILEENSLARQATTVAQAQLKRIQREYEDQKVVAQSDLQEAEAELGLAAEASKRYQRMAQIGAVSLLQFKEKQAAFRTASAKVKRARVTVSPSAASIEIAQEQIAQEQAKGRATLAASRREREGLLQKRLGTYNQLIQNQREAQQTEHELQKSLIRATSDGTILTLGLRNQNQVVNPGEIVAQIAPNDQTAVIVKAWVLPQDIHKVEVGQRVQLRVSACPYPDYGTLKGSVTSISADVITGQNQQSIASTSTSSQSIDSQSSSNYFEVNIQPESLSLGGSDRQCYIKPGMMAEASIISREETFLQFLLRKARILTDL